MFSFRSLILLSFTLCSGTDVLAQTPLFQPQQPTQSPQTVQQRVQQVPIVQQQIQAQPVQMQPVQMQQLGTQGGTSVYQQNLNQSQPTSQPAVQQMQMGTNMTQPMNIGQPIIPQSRVATATPGQPVGQPISLYDGGTNQTLQTVQPAAQEIPPGMQHMGRSEPTNRVIPFFLTSEEQRTLDEFLVRWERYSASINRYDVNFNLFMYDPTIPGGEANQPHKVTFGYFKYIANPRRFVYAVEGEWQGDKQIKREGDKNPQIFAEKIIIDEKSVYQYDYNSKTLWQINVPADLIGKGIADNPLPLIFGAKADELKRRFSMKVENVSEEMIRLYARPLLPEDQQEFKELEVLIHKNNLVARALRQWSPHGKAYKVFDLRSPVINPASHQTIITIIKDIFTPDVPRGWKQKEMDWAAFPQSSPPPIPAEQHPRIGYPPSEVPLYRVQ